jgi:hypothetical protein
MKRLFFRMKLWYHQPAFELRPLRRLKLYRLWLNPSLIHLWQNMMLLSLYLLSRACHIDSSLAIPRMYNHLHVLYPLLFDLLEVIFIDLT